MSSALRRAMKGSDLNSPSRAGCALVGLKVESRSRPNRLLAGIVELLLRRGGGGDIDVAPFLVGGGALGLLAGVIAHGSKRSGEVMLRKTTMVRAERETPDLVPYHTTASMTSQPFQAFSWQVGGTGSILGLSSLRFCCFALRCRLMRTSYLPYGSSAVAQTLRIARRDDPAGSARRRWAPTPLGRHPTCPVTPSSPSAPIWA